MKKIFYSIYNDNNELLFANATQYKSKQDATKDLKKLYNKIIKDRNITITAYTNTSLQFTDNPITELEGKEFHKFEII